MITYPPLNSADLRLASRARGVTLEWNNHNISLVNLKSFKKAPDKDAIILTFPYEEIELPCTNAVILLKALDELEQYLNRVNTVEVPPPVVKEAVAEARKNLTITPNQVIKVSSKKQIPLLGLKDVGIEGMNLALYYEQKLDAVNWKAENLIEAQSVYEQIMEHLHRVQVLKIFKNLQLNNPIASADELWKKAEETQSLLIHNKVHLFY